MASRARSLATLRLLLTSGVDVMSQMPVTSEHLKRVFPSFSLSMIRVDGRCAPQQHYSEFFDDFSHHLFATSGHLFAGNADDPAAFGTLLRNREPVGTLVDNRPAYLSGATYQHLFKRNGIHHCLDLAVREADRPLGILGVFREATARPFTRADVDTARQLYPWLVHALAHPADGDAWVETRSAMLVATREGKLLWASEAARRWLEDGTGGPERSRVREGGLLPEACRRVCQQLGRARAGRPADEVPSQCIPVPGGRLRLRAYAMHAAGGADAHVGVHLSLELSQPLRVLSALAASDLSPQLQRCAWRTWQGVDAKALASELQVGFETLKSYRKELYARLDVTSAEALRARLEAQAEAVTFDLARHRPRSPHPRTPP